MKWLYKKSEIIFSFVWMVIYLLTGTLGQKLTNIIGLENSGQVILRTVIAVFLLIWIYKNKLNKKWGFTKISVKPKIFLYFIPLVLISTAPLWIKGKITRTLPEIILFIINAYYIGFYEEITCRGFLFKAISKYNTTSALIVSSVIFSLWHLLNLTSGAPLIETLIQLMHAASLGFMFAVIFYKGKNIIPCIIAHGTIDALNFQHFELSDTQLFIFSLCISILSVLYSIIIMVLDKNQRQSEVSKKVG